MTLDPMSSRRRLFAAAGCAAIGAFGAPMLVRAQSALSDVVTEAEALDQLHALVVHQNGTPLIEEAWRGPGIDASANIKSVSKTIIALLTGIAIERGDISGSDARVLPMLGRPAAGDARDNLTVGHLLSMQAGLESTSGPRYGAWVSSPDWVDHALSVPLVDEPGGRFIYSTGGWHVLGAILAEVTGRSLLDLVRDWLGDPLDLSFPPWQRDPQGRYLGGNQMALTPKGLVRIGDMVLARGAWGGDQVVPAIWLDTSWQPRGRSPWSRDNYGYGWFLTQLDGRAAAYGRGYGGQILAVVPDAGLTIAITSDPNRPARSIGYFGELVRLMNGIVAST